MTRKGRSFSGACGFAWRSTQAQSQTSGWVLYMFERHVTSSFDVASSAAPHPVDMRPSRLGVGPAAQQPHQPLVSLPSSTHVFLQVSCSQGFLCLCYIDSPRSMNASNQLRHKLCCLSNTGIQTHQECSHDLPVPWLCLPFTLMQVHSITKQLEYKGKMVDLTETISHLPAGSQVLLSSASFEKLFGRLHEIRLTAASGPSQGSPQFKQHSKEYTQGLFVSSGCLNNIVAAALDQHSRLQHLAEAM